MSDNAILFRPLSPIERQSIPHNMSLFRSFDSLSASDRIANHGHFLIVSVLQVVDVSDPRTLPAVMTPVEKALTFGIPYHDCLTWNSSFSWNPSGARTSILGLGLYL